ncbi:MAG: putative rRNA maturation factor [Acidobacteriota bacterium]|nr:putative rRNA maturation factor [Acidobacteriota bacterium]
MSPPVSSKVALSGASRWKALGASGLSSWMEELVAELAPDFDSVGVRFAGDLTVRRLNRDFRGQDKTTDVLSFPGDESPEGRHLGDIVISVPTAERQAADRGAALEQEIKLLLLHGVLHCLGHDHETDNGEMEKLEGRLRRRWLKR